jgi:tetratricopeptide (TPR) repeat protein
MQRATIQSNYEEARLWLFDGRFDAAFFQFEKLVRQNPCKPAVWFGYGAAALRLGRLELAEKAWTRVQEFSPEDHDMLLQIGHQYSSCRYRDRAISFYQRAARISSKAINPRISLAVQYEQRHQFEPAREQVEHCLALDPHDEQAGYMSALLDFREGNMSEAERRLRGLVKSELRHEYVRYAARHQLAEICDQTGRYGEAIALLIEAKRLMRGLVPNVDELIKRYDRITREEHEAIHKPKDVLRGWNKTFPEAKRNVAPNLAFLGGHPRSGTTLLEQILDAHPNVAAADEAPAFMTRLMPAFQRTSSSLSPRVLNTVRKLYLDALTQNLPLDGTKRVLIDKNPSPTSRLPIWLRVFPELRVIIALRDPRDVVISCYFQNLPLNPLTVNFLSIERIAIHYANLMDIWLAVREWEGFSWIESRYENMTKDLEGEGKRVTSFLGLSWNEQQAQFHVKSRHKAVYSPTYHAVTEKLHNRSVGRWKHYEEYLVPALSILEPYIKALHYD